jgi:hypothetical protein
LLSSALFPVFAAQVLSPLHKLVCCPCPEWHLGRATTGPLEWHWLCVCGAVYPWVDNTRHIVWDPLQDCVLEPAFIEQFIQPTRPKGWMLRSDQDWPVLGCTGQFSVNEDWPVLALPDPNVASTSGTRHLGGHS